MDNNPADTWTSSARPRRVEDESASGEAHASERRWEDDTRTDFERGERWVRGGYRGTDRVFTGEGVSRTRAADERRARDRGGGRRRRRWRWAVEWEGWRRRGARRGGVVRFKILKTTSSGNIIRISSCRDRSGGRTRRSGARRPSARRPSARVGGAENAETVGEAGEDAEG